MFVYYSELLTNQLIHTSLHNSNLIIPVRPIIILLKIYKLNYKQVYPRIVAYVIIELAHSYQIDIYGDAAFVRILKLSFVRILSSDFVRMGFYRVLTLSEWVFIEF